MRDFHGFHIHKSALVRIMAENSESIRKGDFTFRHLSIPDQKALQHRAVKQSDRLKADRVLTETTLATLATDWEKEWICAQGFKGVGQSRLAIDLPRVMKAYRRLSNP